MLWPVTKAAELVLDAVVVETGVEVAYHTVLSAGSLVVQVTLAVVLAVLVAETPDITGAIVSPGGGGVCPSHFPISSPCLMWACKAGKPTVIVSDPLWQITIFPTPFMFCLKYLSSSLRSLISFLTAFSIFLASLRSYLGKSFKNFKLSPFGYQLNSFLFTQKTLLKNAGSSDKVLVAEALSQRSFPISSPSISTP